MSTLPERVNVAFQSCTRLVESRLLPGLLHVLLDLLGNLFAGEHKLESLEVGQGGLGLLGGDLLSPGRGFPLLDGVGAAEGSLEGLFLGTTSELGGETGQADPLQGDHLSLHAGGRAIDHDLVQGDHVDDGGDLSLERSISDEDETSGFDEALEERCVSHFV